MGEHAEATLEVISAPGDAVGRIERGPRASGWVRSEAPGPLAGSRSAGGHWHKELAGPDGLGSVYRFTQRAAGGGRQAARGVPGAGGQVVELVWLEGTGEVAVPARALFEAVEETTGRRDLIERLFDLLGFGVGMAAGVYAAAEGSPPARGVRGDGEAQSDGRQG